MNEVYTKQEQEDKEFFLTRKAQLEAARTETLIENVWRQADLDYTPHKLGYATKKKVLVENERTEVSSYVNLQKDQWRSRDAKNDPYIKIQTAISILFDRNPEAVFDPASKRFEKNTAIMEHLYHRSWSDIKLGSKKELRKFIFNLAKYGWSPARRYYKQEIREGLNMVKEYSLQTDEFVFEKKDKTDVDDVYFESKSPFDVWIDDMARPDDPRSRRDWMWREVFDKTKLEKQFAKSKNIELVQYGYNLPLGNEEDRNNRQYTSTDLVEVFFYENRVKDKLMVYAGDVLLVTMPLPSENKELSLIDTYWTYRSTESPYGIGLNEIMRLNKTALDKVRNMTIDQVVLSIYKMFLYSGSEQLADEGGENISLEPGKGKKVIDPKNITWSNIPGPGQDSYNMIEMLKNDMDDDTGITKTLEGEIEGKTAFETSQALQGALKRLGTPLRNIQSALEWDAYLTVSLIKMVYSVPRVQIFTDPDLISEYIAEVNDDQELYFMDEEGQFNALEYREFQLNIEQNQDGNFEASENKKFFMLRPSWLEWDGEITIRVESMVEMSKPLERQMKLEMSNILIPLIGQMAQSPIMQNAYIKPVKQILKLYNENPKDWLPVEWLSGQMGQPGMMGMMNLGMGGETLQGQTIPGAPEAEQVVPSAEMSTGATESGLIDRSSQILA